MGPTASYSRIQSSVIAGIRCSSGSSDGHWAVIGREAPHAHRRG